MRSTKVVKVGSGSFIPIPMKEMRARKAHEPGFLTLKWGSWTDADGSPSRANGLYERLNHLESETHTVVHRSRILICLFVRSRLGTRNASHWNISTVTCLRLAAVHSSQCMVPKLFESFLFVSSQPSFDNSSVEKDKVVDCMYGRADYDASE